MFDSSSPRATCAKGTAVALGELYKLQSCNKITPRRAAVMAYPANLLLPTLPAIALETDPAAGVTRIILRYAALRS